jgi:hypothetical protein
LHAPASARITVQSSSSFQGFHHDSLTNNTRRRVAKRRFQRRDHRREQHWRPSLQDFMGKYNSYLQRANSVIQQSNQTLGELARAR